MDRLIQGVRYSARSLVRSPGFALVAVLTLGIGIGGTTAIFSAIHAVLLRPLPSPDLDRIVMVQGHFRDLGLTNTALGPAEVADLGERTDLFAAAAGIVTVDWNLTGSGEPIRLAGALTYGDFFEVFSVRAHLGRLYTAEHSTSGEHEVVVLSHGAWRRLTGGDESVLGTTIQLDGLAREVIGVLPPEFRFPRGADVLKPINLTPELRQNRGMWNSLMVARVRGDVTRERLAHGLDGQAAGWNREFFASLEHGRELVAVPVVEYLAGPLRLILWVLMGAVGLVLLIACANVASLQLVRATGRARELAVRAAMGAGRGRIIRQTMLESGLLALGGAAVAVLLGTFLLDLLARLDPTTGQALEGVRLNGAVLAFTALAATLAAVASGAVPALRASRTEPQQALRAVGGASADRSRHRMLKGSVAFQVALSLILLVASGLMIRSLGRLLDTDPGFRAERLVTAQIALPQARYAGLAQRSRFADAVLARIGGVPGVEAAATAWALPFSDHIRDSSPFQIEGRPPPGPNDPEWHAEYRIVSRDYFRALGVPVIRGRAFDERDDAEAPRVLVIDEHLANRHFPGEDPIGQRLQHAHGLATVIGVVGSVQHGELGEPPKELTYYHAAQVSVPWLGLAVRTSLDQAGAAGLIRAAVREVDPELPVYDIATMDDRIRRSLGDRRLAMGAMGAFAAVALLLAMLGVYGVMRYSTHQRTREIGIRVALGAKHEDVLRMVVLQAMAIVGIGIGVGLLAAAVLTRFMSGMLYEVGARDPLTFVGVPLVLACVALAAAYLPARRAAKTDPMVAVRTE